MSARRWWELLKRTVAEFRDDNLMDWAAALTYYAVLALFPALLLLVSILGLIGTSATQPLLDNLGTLAPNAANDIVSGAVRQVHARQGAAGLAFAIALVVGLWTASNYVNAFFRASNEIYGVEEGRPFWRMRPLSMVTTLAMILLIALCAIAIVVSGPVAREAGDLVGVGDEAVTAWDLAKWPVIALVVMTVFALLYGAAPNERRPGFRWITAGGVVALALWIAASGAFTLYVSNFGAYNKTYGSLAGVIVFLVWLWIANLAILLGAELNSQLDRDRRRA